MDIRSLAAEDGSHIRTFPFAPGDIKRHLRGFTGAVDGLDHDITGPSKDGIGDYRLAVKIAELGVLSVYGAREERFTHVLRKELLNRPAGASKNGVS